MNLSKSKIVNQKSKINMDVFEKLVKDGGPIGQHMDRAHGYFTFPMLEKWMQKQLQNMAWVIQWEQG